MLITNASRRRPDPTFRYIVANVDNVGTITKLNRPAGTIYAAGGAV